MDNGWIRLHRSITKKGWYRSPNYLALWIHLLVKANHKPTEYLMNNTIQKLEPGQFITGRKKLAQETGINENSIERILTCFKNEQQIEQQPNSKFRLITIKNWKQYQESEQVNEQPANSQPTASQQPVNTDKNVRIKECNNKEINKEKISDTSDPAYKALIGLCAMRGLEVDLPSTRYLEMREEFRVKIGAAWWPQVQACVNWCYDHGKKKFTTSRLRNWMVRSIQFAKEKEIKQQQNYQDKKTSPKKPLAPNFTPTWTPPL